MSQVRVLSQGLTQDYVAFARLMKRETAYIEENEPGTLVMECFADDASGRVVVHEVYADADAFIVHVESLMGGDRITELAEVFELKRLTFLTRIEDERVATIARQFGATEVAGVAGFAR